MRRAVYQTAREKTNARQKSVYPGLARSRLRKIAVMPFIRVSAPGRVRSTSDIRAALSPSRAFVPRVVVLDLDGTAIDYQQNLQPRVRDAYERWWRECR